MKKIIRHKWLEQEGAFRRHHCVVCGLIRYWDAGFGRLMYKYPTGDPMYMPQPCLGMNEKKIH